MFEENSSNLEGAHILIVEDSRTAAQMIAEALEQHPSRYRCDFAYTGEQALQSVSELHPDLILLDIHLPGADGYEVAQWLRAEGYTTPIIMLTAIQGERAFVKGFQSGCDDYVTKPFTSAELCAHIEAQFCRQQWCQPTVSAAAHLSYADVTMNVQARTAFRGTRKLDLTEREYQLLAFFLHYPEQALTRERLQERIWGGDHRNNVVDVYVRYLRTKLESNGEVRLIHTIWGRGYILQVPQHKV